MVSTEQAQLLKQVVQSLLVKETINMFLFPRDSQAFTASIHIS